MPALKTYSRFERPLAVRELAAHDKPTAPLDGLGVIVFRNQQAHYSPRSIDNRRKVIIDPLARNACLGECCQRCLEVFSWKAHHVILAPPAVSHLLSDDEATCAADTLAAAICLTIKRKRLQRKHGRVGEADAPASEPASIGALRFVYIGDGSLNCRPVQLSARC